MRKVIRLVGFSIASMVVVNTGYAKDAFAPGDSDSRWVVGGTALSINNIYAGEDNIGVIVPNFAYRGDNFFVKNGSLNLTLLEKGKLSFGATAGIDASFLSKRSRYEDNSKLAGLKERDATVEGGFYINHTTNLGRLKFKVLSDLGDKHNGQTASLSYTFDFKQGNWNINPVLGMNWISDKKTNHLYGVSQEEATSSRNAYQADSALNLFAGIRGRYEFTDHWDMSIHTGVTRLDSSIRKSSIVDEDYTYHAAVSVNYNF